MARVFVYGTLLGEEQVREVLGRVPRSRPAMLRGFRRVAHPGGPWFVAERDEMSVIEGRVLEGVSGGGLDRLDRYEGVSEGLYERVAAKVEVAGRGLDAWVYVKV